MENKLIYCACGCGEKIKIKKHHKYYGIPKFIHGHSSGRHLTKEDKKEMVYCKCGCGTLIKRFPYVVSQERRYLMGHQRRGREMSKEFKIQQRNRQLGKKYPKELFPNYGMRKKIFSEETKKKLKENNPKYWKGKKFSIEHKKRLKEARKKLFKMGYISPRLGKKQSQEAIDKYKEWRSNKIYPLKDTKIEVKIQDFLEQLKLEYFKHKYMHIEHGYQCDILIPKQEGIEKDIIIECFGDYWHKIPYGNPLDSLRCQELRAKGFRVLVFWEREIKVMELNDLKEEL